MLSTKQIPKNETETVEELTILLPQLLEGLTIESVERRVDLGEDETVDLLVKVRHKGTTRRLLVDVKTLGEPRFAAESVTRLRTLQGHMRDGVPVFAARYVSEESRRICRTIGVGYMDLVGNVYLAFGPVLIDRESGHSLKLERRGLRQLTAPKATRVLRALLMNPDRPARITDLAEACSMTPGGVHQVVRLLEDRGYVARDPSRRVVLERPDELLDAWASSWTMERNGSRGYFSLERSPEAIMRAVARQGRDEGLGYAFTLYAGASLVAPFVRFITVHLYIEGDERRWVEGLDLRPVQGGGNVVLLRPYDEGVLTAVQDVRGTKVVPDVQLYVDLYNHPARGREQAEFLRAKRLAFGKGRG